MTEEKRFVWLNTLKEGDEVGVIEEIEGIRYTINYSSDLISAIEKNGTFSLANGTVFNHLGEFCYENPSLGVRFKYKVIPLTEEIKKKRRFYHINKLVGLITGG